MSSIVPRGWCPTVYEPMATGDGLLVRMRPRNAMLSGATARRLAMAATYYGNGVIELTSRAGIQVRGLKQDTVRSFATAMIAAGLVDVDPEVERRRVVIVPPFPNTAVQAVAAQIEAAFHDDPRLQVLPPKIAIAVDASETVPLGDIGADIHVVCGGPTCAVTLMVTEEEAIVAPAEVPETVTHMTLGLFKRGARRRPLPRAPKAIGWLSCRALGLGLPFGETAAKTLAALADLSERYGDGTLRITPWRVCIIPDVSFATAWSLREAGAALGLIVDPADRRLSVVACPGQPACVSATVTTRADAVQLAKLGLPGTVHISGCAKGCAHPGPARTTLVGENGRYQVVRNGRPGDAPSISNLTLAEVIAVLRT